MEDELYNKGIEIREQMWGPDGAQAKVDRASDFQRDFEELVTRYCFGATWGRPGLTHGERSMLTLGMLIVHETAGAAYGWSTVVAATIIDAIPRFSRSIHDPPPQCRLMPYPFFRCR